MRIQGRPYEDLRRPGRPDQDEKGLERTDQDFKWKARARPDQNLRSKGRPDQDSKWQGRSDNDSRWLAADERLQRQSRSLSPWEVGCRQGNLFFCYKVSKRDNSAGKRQVKKGNIDIYQWWRENRTCKLRKPKRNSLQGSAIKNGFTDTTEVSPDEGALVDARDLVLYNQLVMRKKSDLRKTQQQKTVSPTLSVLGTRSFWRGNVEENFRNLSPNAPNQRWSRETAATYKKRKVTHFPPKDSRENDWNRINREKNVQAAAKKNSISYDSQKYWVHRENEVGWDSELLKDDLISHIAREIVAELRYS